MRDYKFDSGAPDQKIVIQFLKQPALAYIRELRQMLDKDLLYLQSHTDEIRPRVRQLLWASGIYWDNEIFDREWQGVVKEAITQLRSVEK